MVAVFESLIMNYEEWKFSENLFFSYYGLYLSVIFSYAIKILRQYVLQYIKSYRFVFYSEKYGLTKKMLKNVLFFKWPFYHT